MLHILRFITMPTGVLRTVMQTLTLKQVLNSDSVMIVANQQAVPRARARQPPGLPGVHLL